MSKKDEMSSRRESKRGECSNRKELLKSHGSEGDNFQKFQTDVSPMKIVKSSVKLP